MIQILNRIPLKLSTAVTNSTLRNSPAISALSLNYRHKSTGHPKKAASNQKILKLEKSENCPPKETAIQAQSSNSSTPPPNSDLTKWILIGGAIAAGAGFFFYNNSQSKDETSAIAEPSTKLVEKNPENFRSPLTTKDIPKHVPYLLIGGGTASFAAFRAIKSNEPTAKVMVISDETVMPYMRPPLSKEIWFDTQLGVEKARFKQWNGAERSVYYEPEDFYMLAEKLSDAKNGGVSVIRGYSVVKLNVSDQKVLLDDGTELTYDKCLIATGSRPKTLEIFDRAPANVRERVHSFKSIKDFEALKSLVEKSKKIAIVGNGFLGSELACALAHYGKDGKLKVHQLFHESGNMSKVLPSYLSEWTTERVRQVGVDVHPKSQITDVEIYEGNQLRLTMNDGKSIIVDHVIQAVGSEPNVSLAKDAGLEIDPKLGGFVVNAELGVRSNIYAAGDVACFYDPKLGRRRVEHHDHAVVSGRLAGENMVGLKKPYKHQSMFWSDLGSAIGYEAIGLVDSSLPTFAVFAKYDPNDEMRVPYNEHHGEEPEKTTTPSPPAAGEEPEKLPAPSPPEVAKPTVPYNPYENYGKGVIFYKQNDRIVGILLWNVFNRISTARKVLMSDEKFDDLNEVAKLFDIFEQHHDDIGN